MNASRENRNSKQEIKTDYETDEINETDEHSYAIMAQGLRFFRQMNYSTNTIIPFFQLFSFVSFISSVS